MLYRKKIKFDDLISGLYGTAVRIQVLAWMLKNSREYTMRSGWYEYGWDKLIYGYGANNHMSYIRVKDPEHVELMLYRALYSQSAPPEVLKFRADNKIDVSKFFPIDIGNPYLSFGKSSLFHIIKNLEGKEIKKEFAHPDYQDRTKPVITSAKFTISSFGYHIFYHFTFQETPGSGWDKEFSSKEKSLPEFLEETFRAIDNSLVDPFIFT